MKLGKHSTVLVRHCVQMSGRSRICISLVVAAMLVAVCVPVAVANLSPTRSCGYVPIGIGFTVRASKGVTCRLARGLMKGFFLGAACSSGSSCRLGAFSCSSREVRRLGISVAVCVSGRRVATGVQGP